MAECGESEEQKDPALSEDTLKVGHANPRRWDAPTLDARPAGRRELISFDVIVRSGSAGGGLRARNPVGFRGGGFEPVVTAYWLLPSPSGSSVWIISWKMVFLREVLWRDAELPPLCRAGRTYGTAASYS